MPDDRDNQKRADYQKLSSTFKVVNRYVLVLWRLRLGWCMSICPPLLGRVMLISHTGRKSGIVRQTPVNYRMIDGSVWLMALPAAAWWRNLQAEPRTELHLPFRRRRGVVKEVPIDAEHLGQIRAVLTSGGWIAATLDRFHGRRASDAEVLEHVHGFHLLQVVDLEPIGEG
ncbi:MAG TPA: nitroreductase/quinone reductase family protein [Kineosporiaceae bacterium]|nr:nitroreductase/quinone reductase family protein [Kineosporiaceae bacterium]